MVREIVEERWLQMVPHTVDFNPLIVIDVQVALLCYCKHCVVLQEAHVIDLLLGLKLHYEVLPLPIEHGEMTFITSKQDMSSIFRH